MQDNFDLKKYLRYGNKLLNENIGGYFDLKPINRLSEDFQDFIERVHEELTSEESDWLVDNIDRLRAEFPKQFAKLEGDVDGMTKLVKQFYFEKDADSDMNEDDGFIQAQRDAVGAKGSRMYGDNDDDGFIQAQRDAVGRKGSQIFDKGWQYDDDAVTIELDMAWDDDEAAQDAFDQFGIEVQEINGNPGTFEVTGRKEDILAYLKSEFYGMDDQDIATYYPELLDGEMNEGEPDVDQYDGEYDSQFGPAITSELEKPKSIYATDDSEDEIGFDVPGDDEEFGSYQDRIMGLGGDKIENGIMSLLDDGFEPEDVMDFCKMIIDAHSQGNKF